MKKFLALCAIIISGVFATPSGLFKGYKEIPIHRNDDHEKHPELDKLHFGKQAFVPSNPEELKSDYWIKNGKDFLEEQINKLKITNKAKNVIFFLGDGMSVATIASARVLNGGEHVKLSFENFPYTAMSKTYSIDKQVADSAATATAYLTGVKANDATIGLNAGAKRMSCVDGSNIAFHTESIASWAMKAGKDAGLVTTTRVSHASPAGVYSHISERDWERDTFVTRDNCDPNLVDDITEQLVHGEVGQKLKVVLGCGAREFLDSTITDDDGENGSRNDGKNLINEWKNINSNRVFVSNKDDLMNIDVTKGEQVLGIFGTAHCLYNLEVKEQKLEAVKPSLAEMTEKAIKILSQNENGYFLFAEGGRIDHGHHKNLARAALDETIEFSKAIEVALNLTSEQDTLIVVTADHGHAFSYGGYAPRGNDIFGIGGVALDRKPYFTLGYANGEGFLHHFDGKRDNPGRVHPDEIDKTPILFQHPSTLPFDFESHGGEDVIIYAKGPMAHLFSGTIEQNVIPHIINYASCLGEGRKMCDEN